VFDGGLEEPDLVGLEKLEDVAGHLGAHLVILAVDGGGGHLEGVLGAVLERVVSHVAALCVHV
jgi:hypothetical protein